jgi:hypothetical protein
MPGQPQLLLLNIQKARGYKEVLARRLLLVSSREGQTPNLREAEGDTRAY